MSLKVGGAIRYKGRDYLCQVIERRECQMLASDDSVTMRASVSTEVNVKHLSLEIDTFNAGDVITLSCEWAQLTHAEDTQYVYTRYHVKKEVATSDEEQNNGCNGSNDANETPSPAAEANDERTESEPGSGGSGSGEGSRALDGDGRGGEERDVSDPGECAGDIPTPTNNRSYSVGWQRYVAGLNRR